MRYLKVDPAGESGFYVYRYCTAQTEGSKAVDHAMTISGPGLHWHIDSTLLKQVAFAIKIPESNFSIMKKIA